MLIVRFQGGIGNQMFQYALYRQMQAMGCEVKADISTYEMPQELRRYKLEEAFGIEVEQALEKEMVPIIGGRRTFFQKVVKTLLNGKNWYGEKNLSDIKDVRQIKKGYFNGYWQSERWFPSIKEQLGNEFRFQTDDQEFLKLCRRVGEEQSVSIHVRLGDYLNNEEEFGGICTVEYYEKAVQYINDRVQNPVYYVISDEPDKAYELLSGIVDAEYIRNPVDVWDMQFMSSCRHNILANSSFSWWSTYLNRHEDKMVVAPLKWNNFEDCSDVYVKGWIQI